MKHYIYIALFLLPLLLLSKGTAAQTKPTEFNPYPKQYVFNPTVPGSEVLQGLKDTQAKIDAQARVAAEEAQKTKEAAKSAASNAGGLTTHPPATSALPPVYISSCGDAKSCIYDKESGNNPASVNETSGACGLGQAFPCSKMPCSQSDYACQDAYFTAYMVSRYGTWEAAWAHWQAASSW